MATNTLVPPELLDPVVAYFNPRRIILFGSTARGEASVNSDIDLLVILDDDTPPERLTLRAGCEARRSYNQSPADVIPCREATFETKRWIAGTLPHEAARDGIVVYERR
jgi:nucleotidyltransferase-like protein